MLKGAFFLFSALEYFLIGLREATSFPLVLTVMAWAVVGALGGVVTATTAGLVIPNIARRKNTNDLNVKNLMLPWTKSNGSSTDQRRNEAIEILHFLNREKRLCVRREQAI